MSAVLINQRETLKGVNPLFLQRYSTRAFSQKPITLEKQTRIFEAARWAPSCYNEQPWQIYTSTTQTFGDFLSLLDSFNQKWAKHANVIGFLIANTRFKYNAKNNDYAGFDCGAAWMAMALQALEEGIYIHAMGGIEEEKAERYFKTTHNQRVLIGFAMGYPGDTSTLSESLQAEERPTDRKTLSEIWKQIT